MSEKFKIVETGINERGFMSAGTIESLYGITHIELEAMVLLEMLCRLSNGCYDLPERLEARLARYHEIVNHHD